MNSQPGKNICSKCSKEYKAKSSYYKHIKVCQGGSQNHKNEPKYMCKEEDCNFSYKSSIELINHLKSVHEKEVPFHHLNFENYSEFELWKNDIEKETKSFFVFRSSRKNKNERVEYFYCNRSGSYESKSRGKRLPKFQGPSKIGFCCLASMKVITHKTDKVSVTFCPLHYGHDQKLSHVPLSKEDKRLVAQQLLSKIPHHEILRNNFVGEAEKVERKHLMTKQDIVNVSRKYGMENEQKHPDDHVSVELYFKDSIEKRNIILFKRQEEENLFFPEEIENTLEKNDFALAIMTDFQKNMLQKFGNHIVCLDSTHKTNYYEFNLITLLVIDEFQEGIPIGWLVSNRENAAVLKLFFTAIKREVGDISPQILMSDNAPQYYSSWIHVFGGDVKKLICHWHVHHDWQKQLNKIKEKDTAKTVYKGLCLLLEEGDEGKFEEMLKNCIEDLEDNPKTQSFGEYFKKEWVNNKEHWAKCYRLSSTINTNMYLESFHKVLKYSDGYFKRKQGRRLDKCLAILLKFSKDLSMKRLVKLEKGKTNKKMTEIHKRHQNSLLLPSKLVFKTSDQTWEVKSTQCIPAEKTAFDNFKYKVSQNSKCEMNCQVKCLECNICVHSYSCDCPDGLTSSTICKHIHLVIRCFQRDLSEQEVGFNNFKDSVPDSNDAAENEPSEYILKSINPNHQIDLKSLKENLMKKYSELKEKIEACQNTDLLIAAKQHINNASNILDLSETNTKLFTQKIAQPVLANNKNTEKQYRFFSTKKQRRGRSVKYAKPTSDEKSVIENSLLGNNSKLDNQNDHSYSVLS